MAVLVKHADMAAERAADALKRAEAAVHHYTPDLIGEFVRGYPSSLPEWRDRRMARACMDYTQELRAEDYKAIRDAVVFAAGLAINAVLEHRQIDLGQPGATVNASEQSRIEALLSLFEDGIDSAAHDWLWDYLPRVE